MFQFKKKKKKKKKNALSAEYRRLHSVITVALPVWRALFYCIKKLVSFRRENAISNGISDFILYFERIYSNSTFGFFMYKIRIL
jgi:hypothetical protein